MIVWDKSLEVGIKQVDEQHKGLVDKINELQNAMKEGKGKEKIGPIINFLKDYALKHFTTEEGLMRMHGYPGMAAHKAKHEDFNADFIKLAEELNNAAQSSLLSIQVQSRLTDWLINHIKKVDKETMAYLASKGAR